MPCMGNKNRTVRLDDDNFKWLTELPGRSVNDAITAFRERNGTVTVEAKVDEILELARDLPGPLEIEEIVQRVVGEGAAEASSVSSSVADKRPKNCFCKHCGSRFAGTKYASICADCKSSGHTLQPSECPGCNEATAL